LYMLQLHRTVEIHLVLYEHPHLRQNLHVFMLQKWWCLQIATVTTQRGGKPVCEALRFGSTGSCLCGNTKFHCNPSQYKMWMLQT
jgi:hypothetical protein